MSDSVILSAIHDFFKTLHSIIYAKTTDKMWLRLVFILAIALFFVISYNKKNTSLYQEGFDQSESFVLRENNNIYDNFYSDKYDVLMKPEERAIFEINAVIQMTNPSENSVFLDIGSGTGDLVNKLQSKGYSVYGIDKSPSMVEKCQQKYPESEVVCKDVSDPMTFEHNTFSHILCTGFTIYHMQDKEMFFKNSYYWLRQNGYLIIHLVDRDTYDPITPIAKPTFMDNLQKYTPIRITKSEVDFTDYSYKSDVLFPKDDIKVIVKETFTDNNGHVRQNENTLYMEPTDTILKIAIKHGFIVHSKIDMSKQNGDEHQYLYVLERTM